MNTSYASKDVKDIIAELENLMIRFNEALNRAEAADRPEPTGWELE